MAEQLVTIFGATGYTGRLCAAEAVRAGLGVRLAGRRQDALAALARELGGDIETAVADAHDPDALRALAETTDVLVTTVGPYDEPGAPGAHASDDEPVAGPGRPVLEAALAGGAHYLDVSGEAVFLDWAYAQHERAADAGLVMAPGFGFDGAPGELLAALAAEELRGGVRDVRVGYLVAHGAATLGTARTMARIAQRGGLALEAGMLVREPPLTRSWTLPFPEPLGPRPGLSVPAPEVVMVGRSLGATAARVYIAAPALPGVSLAAGAVGRAAQVAARTPLWSSVRWLADRLPEGPSATRRRRARCAVVVEVAGGRGTARAWCRMSDVYATTAKIVVAALHRILMGGIEPGARTPSQVAGDAEGFLDDIGARWDRLPPA